MKKALVTHGSWAGICALVFAWGILRDPGPLPGGKGGAKPLPAPLAARLINGAGEPGQAGRTLPGNAAPPGGVSARLLAEAFGGNIASSGDWEKLARQSVRDPNPIVRRLAFTRLLEAMTPENARDIRKELVASGADGDQWRDFNYSWGALAGREAFDFAAESEERDLDAALAGWASASPAEALALIRDLPDGMQGRRDSLIASVVSGLADSDRVLATEFIVGLKGGDAGRAAELIGVVARESLRADGVEAASLWSESLPDGPVKGAAMQRVAEEFAKSDPEAAARWAQRHADEDYAANVVAEVGQKWAARNPVEAVSWLESLPEGRGQVAGLNSAFGDWEDRDPAAAAEYLFNMPASAKRDSAISGFSRGYAWQDPLTAIAWAFDIADPSIRQETLTRAGQVFYRKDPAAARAWVETSDLPPATRDAVLNAPRR